MQQLPFPITTDPVKEVADPDVVASVDISVGGFEVGGNDVGVKPYVPQPVNRRSIPPMQIICCINL